jgi:serine/threonine-protein kinase
MLGGRYRLVRPIARGGMADVWEGHDEVLSRPVAVKLLRPHLAEDGVFLERFRREAVTAARLAHPGVVSTFDTGIDLGTAYIVMELVRGRTLRQLLDDNGPLSPWLAVAITRQIADVLTYAHQAGLVHRDIKPANVLLTDDEWGGLRVKVMDFGIAKAGSSLGGDLTRTGIILGTPKYLSPEQISGKEPDARADLYSVGVVLFEMLTGSPPFVGTTDLATALAHLNDRPPRVSARVPGVPPALDRLVGDLLTKDPQRRVPSASALRKRLDELNLTPASAVTPGGRHSRGRSGDSPGGVSQRTAAVGPLVSVPAADATVSAPKTGPAPNGRFPSANREPSTAVTQGSGHGQPAPGNTDRPSSTGRRGLARRRRGPGLVVLGLVVAGVTVGGVLLAGPDKRPPAAPLGNSPSATRPISAVSLFMLRGKPDDPQGLPLILDGNPATAWHTDQYHTPEFSNLYPGLGLVMRLSDRVTLHHLTVTSPTVGWAAQTYVSSAPVAAGKPLSAWGQPTDTKTGISGSTTFDLRGRHGQFVLLWLTRLGSSGPPFQASVNAVSLT